jgi:hypothetical protein
MIMGTRSLTYVYDDDMPLVCMYRQCDGYPSGHGTELAEFLLSGKMVNGLSGDDTKVFNGMCCLAAQMVAHFKQGPGGIYLMPPTPGADHGQEYEYHVRFEDQIKVKVMDEPENVLFDGALSEFIEFCAKE